MKMFGVTPQSKIIDFLVENDLWYYSALQLSHQTGVKLKKVNDILYLLKSYKMIVPHKDNRKIFSVNKKSPIMASLVQFDYQLGLEGFYVCQTEDKEKMKNE